MKKVANFFLIWTIGFIVASIIVGFLQKPRWEKISQLHRPGSRLVTISPELVVEAVDGTLYESCGENCWYEVPPGAVEFSIQRNIASCDMDRVPPRLDSVISLKEKCEFSVPVNTHRVCAMTSSSAIFCWEYSPGWEFLTATVFGCIFTFPFPLYGLIFLFAEGLSRTGYWVHKKVQGSEEGSSNQEE